MHARVCTATRNNWFSLCLKGQSQAPGRTIIAASLFFLSHSAQFKNVSRTTTTIGPWSLISPLWTASERDNRRASWDYSFYFVLVLFFLQIELRNEKKSWELKRVKRSEWNWGFERDGRGNVNWASKSSFLFTCEKKFFSIARRCCCCCCCCLLGKTKYRFFLEISAWVVRWEIIVCTVKLCMGLQYVSIMKIRVATVWIFDDQFNAYNNLKQIKIILIQTFTLRKRVHIKNRFIIHPLTRVDRVYWVNTKVLRAIRYCLSAT